MLGKLLSYVQLSVIPWTTQSMEFSRPEYWSSLSRLQGIFPTQGLNPGLPHCRQILYQLRHKGSPRILEWVNSLLQGIFPTQGSSWGVPHCRRILYHLSHQGSPALLERPSKKEGRARLGRGITEGTAGVEVRSLAWAAWLERTREGDEIRA